MAILQKHRPQIFGLATKVNYDKTVDEGNVMIFEHDVHKIEKADSLPHCKLKPKKIVLPQLN